MLWKTFRCTLSSLDTLEGKGSASPNRTASTIASEKGTSVDSRARTFFPFCFMLKGPIYETAVTRQNCPFYQGDCCIQLQSVFSQNIVNLHFRRVRRAHVRNIDKTNPKLHMRRKSKEQSKIFCSLSVFRLLRRRHGSAALPFDVSM